MTRPSERRLPPSAPHSASFSRCQAAASASCANSSGMSDVGWLCRAGAQMTRAPDSIVALSEAEAWAGVSAAWLWSRMVVTPLWRASRHPARVPMPTSAGVRVPCVDLDI